MGTTFLFHNKLIHFLVFMYIRITKIYCLALEAFESLYLLPVCRTAPYKINFFNKLFFSKKYFIFVINETVFLKKLHALIMNFIFSSQKILSKPPKYYVDLTQQVRNRLDKVHATAICFNEML
jgi:hypothetical protein